MRRQSRLVRPLILLLVALLIIPLFSASGMPSTAIAQPASNKIYVPTIAVNAQFPSILPEGETTIDLGMTILDSPAINPIYIGGTRWLILVFRVDAGSAKNGGYQLEIDTATRTVVSGRAVGPRAADEAIVAPAAAGRVANTQLSQVKDPSGQVSVWYVYSPNATGRGSQIKVLR